ncbi:hypothetical protein ES702_03296 [subsurface metagenome]
MVNVLVLCTKCRYQFLTNVKNIDAFKRGLPGTSTSCPRCRRKKWLTVVWEGARVEADG